MGATNPKLSGVCGTGLEEDHKCQRACIASYFLLFLPCPSQPVFATGVPVHLDHTRQQSPLQCSCSKSFFLTSIFTHSHLTNLISSNPTGTVRFIYLLTALLPPHMLKTSPRCFPKLPPFLAPTPQNNPPARAQHRS